jgi:Kef-type K+ transport system membrane component KefB
MTVSFDSVAIVAAVAVLAPLAIGASRLRLPAIVLEILLGIAVGPQGLGWASVDEPVTVLSRLGLAFLLLLAGLEIDFARLPGRLLRITSLAFAVSFVLAIAVGYLLRAGGLVRSPLLIAIILSATGLVLLIGFLFFVIAVGITIVGLERSTRFSALLSASSFPSFSFRPGSTWTLKACSQAVPPWRACRCSSWHC